MLLAKNDFYSNRSLNSNQLFTFLSIYVFHSFQNGFLPLINDDLVIFPANVSSSVIGSNRPIEIAVKSVPHQLESSNNGVLVSRAASLVMGGLYTGPYFDPFTPTEISVQVGSNALLPCRVRQAGNRSVSPFSS